MYAEKKLSVMSGYVPQNFCWSSSYLFLYLFISCIHSHLAVYSYFFIYIYIIPISFLNSRFFLFLSPAIFPIFQMKCNIFSFSSSVNILKGSNRLKIKSAPTHSHGQTRTRTVCFTLYYIPFLKDMLIEKKKKFTPIFVLISSVIYLCIVRFCTYYPLAASAYWAEPACRWLRRQTHV